MQRLQTLDLEFLAWEDARSPMHIGSASVFAGPAPSRDEVHGLARAFVQAHPHYRERLRRPRLGLRDPAWVEDPKFALERHLSIVRLAPPHDERALATLMGLLMSEVLPRDRPLWALWIVEGMTHRRWAVISKIHHALADGQSGVALLTSLLKPGAPALHALPRAPRAAASRPGPAVVPDLIATLTGLGRLAGGLRWRSETSIQGCVGARRSYATCAVSLEDVQRVRHALGGTVNDVVLALLAGAYRAFLQQRGDDVDRGPIRALVPLSTRGGSDAQDGGNHIAALLCDLPTHLHDPGARLDAVRAHTRELKGRSHMREGGEWLLRAGARVPSWVRWAGTRAVVEVLNRFPQHAIATIATHVRGPDQPLHLLGRELLACYPYVPIMQGARVGTAVLSYAGVLAFGITADAASVPDPEVLADAIGRELSLLLVQASAAPRAGTDVCTGP